MLDKFFKSMTVSNNYNTVSMERHYLICKFCFFRHNKEYSKNIFLGYLKGPDGEVLENIPICLNCKKIKLREGYKFKSYSAGLFKQIKNSTFYWRKENGMFKAYLTDLKTGHEIFLKETKSLNEIINYLKKRGSHETSF